MAKTTKLCSHLVSQGHFTDSMLCRILPDFCRYPLTMLYINIADAN